MKDKKYRAAARKRENFLLFLAHSLLYGHGNLCNVPPLSDKLDSKKRIHGQTV